MNEAPPNRPPDFAGTAPPSAERRPGRYRLPLALLGGGLLLLLLGTGPLLLVILFAEMGWSDDPNPNPVGFGILAMCTAWPSIGFVIAGVGLGVVRWTRGRGASGSPR
ncbi:MAG: hypothetical protein EXS01_02195 [Phycisphaerales bacterium]|nr:hypothetical protein [Phycisphaerales bacterium]